MLNSRAPTVTYTARTDVILNLRLKEEDMDADINLRNDITLSQRYMQSVQVTMTSKAVSDKAQEIYNEYCAINNLATSSVNFRAVGTSNNEDSLIFQIRYSDTNAQASRDKLDAVIKAANIEFKNDPFLKEANIKLIPTQTGGFPTSAAQNLVTSGIKYALIGLVAGVAIAILRYFLDNKIKDEKELQEIAGVSLLAYIDKQ